MRVGIIGAGFAGVAAAQSVARDGIEVVVFSAEDVLPYFRPRLPGLAFGQIKEDDISMHPAGWYQDKGITLRLACKVKAFTSDFNVILEDGTVENFDSLVISIGAGPVIPPFARDMISDTIVPLWSHSDAVAINRHLQPGSRMVIIGGGVIGIETALRAEDAGLKVTVIEKMRHLMSRNFGEKASEVIEGNMRSHGVEILLDKSVSALAKTADGRIKVEIENSGSISCDFVILAIGAGFNPRIAADAGLKTDRRIVVDDFLHTSVPGIFAAGDIAQLEAPTPCSAKEALAQGRAAGENAVAYVRGVELKKYDMNLISVQLKYKDFELYSIGDVPMPGSQEKILDFEALKVYRGCVYENGLLSGVQMAGSGEDFRKYEKILQCEHQKGEK